MFNGPYKILPYADHQVAHISKVFSIFGCVLIQVLRLDVSGGNFNINWIEFVPINTSGQSSSATSSTGNTPAKITVQSENFIATGGVYQGFQKYTTAARVGAINYNQRGDWADYNITVSATGNYRINAYLGTIQTGGAIEILVDGVSVAKKTVPNNNNWDTFALLEVRSSVRLTQGAHKVRIFSAGTTASTWEWNADRIEFIPVN